MRGMSCSSKAALTTHSAASNAKALVFRGQSFFEVGLHDVLREFHRLFTR